MSDLISREALRKAFHERIYYFDKSSWDEANALIDTAPTVTIDNYSMGYQDGVRKVLSERPTKGKWRTHQTGYLLWEECDQCGAQVGTVGMNFCPNCGSDMRGAKE